MMEWFRDLASSVGGSARTRAARIDARLAAGSDDARRAPPVDLHRRTLAALRPIPPAREPATPRLRLALAACVVLVVVSAVVGSLLLGRDTAPSPAVARIETDHATPAPAMPIDTARLGSVVRAQTARLDRSWEDLLVVEGRELVGDARQAAQFVLARLPAERHRQRPADEP